MIRAPDVERTAEALQQSKKPPETAPDRLDVVRARRARAAPSNRRRTMRLPVFERRHNFASNKRFKFKRSF
jgi:hypothetical protein